MAQQRDEPADIPEGLTDEDRTHFKNAVFGREVRQFIDEDAIGKYLIERARETLLAAGQALVEVDPNDRKKIEALQLDARVANRVRGWLAEAVETGLNSESVLQQQRDEHGG